MNRILTITLILLCSLSAVTGQDGPGPRLAPTRLSLEEIPRQELPLQDNAALRAEANRRREMGAIPAFARAIEVAVNPASSGKWEALPDGRRIWRHRIISRGAYSLNLGFTSFHLPAGASFLIYTPDKQQIMGPFSPADETDHGQLWTPVIPGADIILELQVPAGSLWEPAGLELRYVNHDFTGIMAKTLAGACNLDVACGQADGWPQIDGFRDAIRAVALFTVGGISSCTGFLVNNSANDCTPYFISARHCGVDSANAASMVVYWNYQNSACRPFGSEANSMPGDGSLQRYNMGARYRAGSALSDMVLVELEDLVKPEANAFFAGWDIDPGLSTGRVASVHHASSEEKRISFSDQAVYRGSWGQGSRPVSNGNYLIVPKWDVGATEGGSSGAPLFNARQQAIGQLRGGAATCSNASYDTFGWLGASWEGGGTPATRLRDWLDPLASQRLSLPGRPAGGCEKTLNATVQNISACISGTGATTLLVNRLFQDSVRLSVSGLPDFVSAVFEQQALKPGASANLTLRAAANALPGVYPFTVNASDGLDTLQLELSLDIRTAPQGPHLPASLKDSAFLVARPALRWIRAPNALSYRLEISRRADFSALEQTHVAAGDTLQQLDTLAAGRYYWRVISRNECGSGISETGSFNIHTGNLSPLNDLQIAIDPNPAHDQIRVLLSDAVSDLKIDLFSINGQLMQSITLPQGSTSHAFDTANYPNGIYLLRIRHRENSLSRLVVIQH